MSNACQRSVKYVVSGNVKSKERKGLKKKEKENRSQYTYKCRFGRYVCGGKEGGKGMEGQGDVGLSGKAIGKGILKVWFVSWSAVQETCSTTRKRKLQV